MTEHREIEHAIGAYLEKVAAEMANVPSDERENILRDIEAHVYESLEKRAGPSPTLDDLNAVLSQMAPPGSYAQPGVTASPEAVPLATAKLCKPAVVGAAILPVGLMVGLIAGTPGLRELENYFRLGAGWDSLLAAIVYILIALSLPAATTILGFIGIRRIRPSRGALMGMPLAVGVAFFYPVIALDLILLACAQYIAEETIWPHPACGAVMAVSALAVMALDVWILAAVWRWASPRPVAGGAAVAPCEARPRLCCLPIVGGLLIPVGLVLLAVIASTFMAMYSPARQKASLEQVIALAFSCLCVGFIVPAIATGFGLAGIAKIRAARGRLAGMLLAVTVSLFYPLCILSAVLCFAVLVITKAFRVGGAWNTAVYFNAFPAGSPVSPAVYLTLVGVAMLLIPALDILIFRWVWRWAARPLRQDELT